ncbi:hypothetical protein C8Q72DRAFT_198548 [Fomitopsis betulina]|nr:hypothetical protein C8Q72DRAFT_198548 [Fomitopsis betulina]
MMVAQTNLKRFRQGIPPLSYQPPKVLARLPGTLRWPPSVSHADTSDLIGTEQRTESLQTCIVIGTTLVLGSCHSTSALRASFFHAWWKLACSSSTRAFSKVYTGRARFKYPALRAYDPSTLYRHSSAMANPNTMFLCSSCGRTFSSELGVRQHARDKGHTYAPPPSRLPVPRAPPAPPADAPAAPAPPRIHACDVCDVAFVSEALLRAHFSISTRHASCSRCGMGFRDVNTLSKHIASVHLSFAGNAPSSTATTPKQLVKPMSAQPVKTAPAVPVTSTSAPSISAARVQGLVDPSIRCTLCDKMCFDLEQHYKYSAQHPKCDLCGAGCATADDVVKHKQAGHPLVWCELCKQQFQASSDLRDHYTDSPSHPKCTSCKVGFPDAEACQSHMADVHPPPVLQTPSPSSSEGSFVEVTRPITPHADVLETRSLPATPLICPTPDTISSTRSTALSIKTQSDALSYSSRPASEPSLPSAFLAGDGAASVPWSAFPLDTLHSATERLFDYVSDTDATTPGREPPPSATTSMSSGVIDLLHCPRSTALRDSASSTALRDYPPFTPMSPLTSESPSMSMDMDRASPLIRTIHVPLGRPQQLERMPSALSLASEHASLRQAATPRSAAATARAAEVSQTECAPPSTSEGRATPRSVPSMSRRVFRSRSVSVASRTSRSRRREASISVSSSSEVSTEPSEPSQGCSTVAPAKASPTVTPKPASSSTAVSWHCRSCLKDPCDQPTATACGHIFCRGCIVKELSTSMACPVCKKMFLLRLFVESV